MLPFEVLPQETLVGVSVTLRAVGWVTEAEAALVQLLASVTVTLYVPADRLDIPEPDPPLLHA
jgi:hypothetical protein